MTFEHFERDLPVCECPSEQRTIWGIVWSCLATVFTCTWVSVHPNIPGPDDSEWKVAKRRAGLMMWTILAPELVIIWAIRQWLGARQLADKFREFNWTKTHGYFLQMGGFILYEDETRKHVLSGQAMERLYREGKIMFPTIAEAEIQDRSKGDGLTKAVAIFQTGWFVAQCIARRAQGLVVTELEIITLAFATLNGMMYFFWWNKPLAIRYSVPVFLLQEPRAERTLTLEGNEPSSFWHQISEYMHRLCVICWHSCTRYFTALRLWKFQWSFLKFSPGKLLKYLLLVMLDPVGEFSGVSEGTWRDSRMSTRYAEVLTTPSLALFQLGIPLVAMGNLFGAIHCIAWSSPFPSDTERILWRICSLILLCAPEVLLVGVVLALELRLIYPLLSERFREAWDTIVLLTDTGIFNHLISPWLDILAILTTSYSIARIALIVEALIALRALTPAALAEVQWAAFIPHI